MMPFGGPQPTTNNGLPSWFVAGMTIEDLDAHLQMFRRQKCEEINEMRKKADFSSFVYKGKEIACNPESRAYIDAVNGEILGAIMVHGEPRLPEEWDGQWKAVDNTYVVIDSVQEWKEFYSAMFNQGLLNFKKAQYLKNLINKGDDLREMMSMGWQMVTPFDAPKAEQPA